MPEEFITRIEYEKRHEDIKKEIIRVDTRVDKIEITINSKDAELHKLQADIRHEMTDNHLKSLDMLHSIKDEVAKDRLATLSMESTLKGEIMNNSTTQSQALGAFQKSLTDTKSKNLRWIVGLIATLFCGGGIGVVVELVRVLLTGKP